MVTITVLGSKGGTGKSTTAFLLGWVIEHCTLHPTGWIDIDIRSATLTESYNNRKKILGQDVPKLFFSALRDVGAYDQDEINKRLIKQLEETSEEEAHVFVVDTPPDVSFKPFLTVLHRSQIAVLPAFLSTLIVPNVVKVAKALLPWKEKDGKRRIFILPIGATNGAVRSKNEELSLNWLKEIDAGIEVLNPIPLSNNIPLCVASGIYPTEWTDDKYRQKKGSELHSAIRQAFKPIEECIEQIYE